MRLFIISSLAIGLATAITVAAEEASLPVEEVEVLGARNSQDTLIDVNLETYNGFENIINRAEFEHRLVDISDVVNQSLSAQIRKNSGFGSYSDFSIRGSTGKQVNLYLDGMLLTSPQSGYSNLSIIPTSIVEQIEIYPDFTPVQLNDANLGGAINIRTRIPNKAFGVRIASSFGSFNTRQQDFDIWGGNEQTNALLALSHAKSANNYPIDRKVICADMTCGSSKTRRNAAYENNSALSKIRHQFNEQYSLQALLASSKVNSGVPHMHNRKSHKAKLKSQLDQFNILLDSQGDELSWGLRFYGNQQDEHFQDKTGTLIVGGGSNIKQKQSTIGGNSFIEHSISSHLLGFNLDYSLSDNITHNLKNSEKTKVQRERLSFAFSDHWQIIESFSLNTVLRGNQVQDKSKTALAGSSGIRCVGSKKDCLNNKNLYWSWQTGFEWVISYWTLKANIGEMIRIPTLTERFGETGAYLGNAKLKPEKSENIDIGILLDWHSSKAQLVLFHKKVKDGIFTIYDSRGVGHPSNTDQAVIYGAEALFKQKIGKYLSLYIGGQWMDSENQSNMKATRGKKVHGIYHINNQTGLLLQSEHHRWDIHYQYDDGLYHNASNTVKAKARKLLNTSYTWFIADFTINLSVNNILDHRYVDFGFMPAPGRSFSTTLTYQF